MLNGQVGCHDEASSPPQGLYPTQQLPSQVRAPAPAVFDVMAIQEARKVWFMASRSKGSEGVASGV